MLPLFETWNLSSPASRKDPSLQPPPSFPVRFYNFLFEKSARTERSHGAPLSPLLPFRLPTLDPRSSISTFLSLTFFRPPPTEKQEREIVDALFHSKIALHSEDSPRIAWPDRAQCCDRIKMRARRRPALETAATLIRIYRHRCARINFSLIGRSFDSSS